MSTRAPTSKLVHAAYVAKAAERMARPEHAEALTAQLAAKFPGPPSPLLCVRLKRSPIGNPVQVRRRLSLLKLRNIEDVSIKLNTPRNNGMLFRIRAMIQVLPLRVVLVKRDEVVNHAISAYVAEQIPGYLAANGIYYLFEEAGAAPPRDLQPFITRLDGQPAFPDMLAQFNERCKAVQENNKVHIKDAVRLIAKLPPQTITAATQRLPEGMVPEEIRRELGGTRAVHPVKPTEQR